MHAYSSSKECHFRITRISSINIPDTEVSMNQEQINYGVLHQNLPSLES